MSSGSLQTKQTTLVSAVQSLITLLIINTCQMRDRRDCNVALVAQWKSSCKTWVLFGVKHIAIRLVQQEERCHVVL